MHYLKDKYTHIWRQRYQIVSVFVVFGCFCSPRKRVSCVSRWMNTPLLAQTADAGVKVQERPLTTISISRGLLVFHVDQHQWVIFLIADLLLRCHWLQLCCQYCLLRRSLEYGETCPNIPFLITEIDSTGQSLLIDKAYCTIHFHFLQVF